MSEERASKAPPEVEATEEETIPIDDESGEMLVDLILAEHQAHAAPEPPEPARIDGIVIARLTTIGAGGEPWIALPWSREPLAARSMAALVEGDLERDVAVLFEGGDPRRPVVMGRMHASSPAAARPTNEAPAPTPTPAMEADGERLVFAADKEIVLRCGKSSITLTRAGKILIRGEYVLTRSSGVNRIQGGSVQIN